MEVYALSIEKKRDKIAGAIYGFAIGDAMGATTEFMDRKQIRQTYGVVKDIIGGGWLNLKPGEVTDDTQMSMCVMDALMEHPYNLERFEKACANNFVKWFESGPKDVGSQCAKGIYKIVLGRRVDVDERALGNGSLMRAMPCALLGNFVFNELQGKLTHNNHSCIRAIKMYSELIQSYLNSKLIPVRANYLMEPFGHVKTTFNNSVCWSQKDSFEEAIIGAVNDGGDADTIAAITGSIAGAKFGYDSIPKKWIEQLNPDVKEYLEKFKNFTFSYLQI